MDKGKAISTESNQTPNTAGLESSRQTSGAKSGVERERAQIAN